VRLKAFYAARQSAWLWEKNYGNGTQISLKRIISKDTLKPPYAYDWLFSDFLELLAKVGTHSGRLSEYGLCENACATSDAYKLKEFIEEVPKDAKQSD
jgi:hypothetical protein